MKLPDLQYDRATPEMASEKAAALPGQLREIEAGVQTVRGVGQQVSRQLEQQADTTARLEAANTRAKIERERTMMRQQVFSDYAQGADDPETLFEGLEERDEAIIDQYTGDLGPRATQYLAPQLAAVRGAYRTGRDASFYEQLVSQRATAAVAEHQATLSAALREDPYDTAPIDRYVESIGNIASTDPDFRRAAEVSGLQTALWSQIYTLGENFDGEGIQAVVESEYFQKANFNPQQVQAVTTMAKEAALAGVENELQVTQNEMVTGKMTVDAGLRQAKELAGNIPGLTGPERQRYAEDAQADLSRRYFSGLIRAGRGQEVISALTEGTKFDTVLDPDDTERLLSAAQQAMGTRAEISMSTLNSMLEDGLASIRAGNAADPKIDAMLEQAQGMTEYMTSSQLDQLELGVAKWETTKQVGQITQNLEQQSAAQLDAAEEALEDWIDTEDGDSFMFRARKSVVDQGLKTIRDARQARLDDPATAAMDASPDVADAYGSVLEGMRPLLSGEVGPEDVPELRARMARYAAETKGVQRQGFELMQDQMRLLPKDDRLAKLFTEGLSRRDPARQLQALSMLSTIAPPDIGNAIANQLTKDNPRLATSLAFIYDGKVGLAEQQLLGGNARAIADDNNPDVNTKTLTDSIQMHPATVALNGLEAQDQRMFRDAIMDVYFGYAQNARDPQAMNRVDSNLLETAIHDVVGPTIQTNAIDANWRTLTYSVNEGGGSRFVTEREFLGQLQYARTRPEEALAALNDNKPKSEWSIPGGEFDLESVLEQGRLRAVADGVYEVYVPQSAVSQGVGVVQSGRVLDQNGQPFRIDMRKIRNLAAAYPMPLLDQIPKGIRGDRGAAY